METWTMTELVAEVAARIARLPEPTNGQVRAVPDERTVRYYGTIGLLARPAATRGRTALYGRRHLAQVVAIKRLQGAGRSLAEITAMWPKLDDHTLQRMSGVELPHDAKASAAFWKRVPHVGPTFDAEPTSPAQPTPPTSTLSDPESIQLELAPNVKLTIALPDGSAVSTADLRAIRAAAASLVTELAHRRLIQEEGS
jgi:DNA-binding transcriptional MerR regulator